MKKTKGIIALLLAFPVLFFAQGRKKLDSLRLLPARASSDTARVKTYNNICFEYQKISPDSALMFAKKAMELADRIHFIAGKAEGLHNMGNIHYFKGDYALAMEYYEQALELRKQAGNKKDIARTTGNIGHVFFAQGNYDKAMEFYRQMLEMGKQINDPATLGDANGNVANIYMMYGNYGKSLEYNLESLKIREEINDTRGMEHSYNNIGGIYFNQGNDKEALNYIRKSLLLQQRMGNKKGMADSYQNIGSIYYHLHKVDTAFSYFNRALKLTEELGNKTGIAVAYDHLGTVYRDNGKLGKALELHLKALAIAEEIGDQKELANVLGNMGGDYIALNNFPAAIQSINRALEIGKRTGAKYYIKNSYDYFVQLYKKMNDAKKALAYYELASAVGDSLLNEKNARSIAEMQARFDTEKKQRQIMLLQKDKNINELQLKEHNAKNYRLRIAIYSLAGGLLLLAALVFFIVRSTREKKKLNTALERKNHEISRQKEIIEQKNILITDSIDYARTLIEYRLPSVEMLKKNFPQHFIFEQAKEIVSGNTWWMRETEENIIIAVIDSKKQGVPGAFLLIRALNRLEMLAKELTEPEEMVRQLCTGGDEAPEAAMLIIHRKNKTAALFSKKIQVLHFTAKENKPVPAINGKINFSQHDSFLFYTSSLDQAGKQFLQHGAHVEDFFRHLEEQFEKTGSADDLLALAVKMP